MLESGPCGDGLWFISLLAYLAKDPFSKRAIRLSLRA